MDMVWHDDKRVHIHAIKMPDYLQPYLFHHLSRLIQFHFPIFNPAKQTLPIMCHNGHEIGTRLGIIIS